MPPLTKEQTYFIGHQIKNRQITLDEMAAKLAVNRDQIDMYLYHNYLKFESYIKKRRNRNAK